MWVDMILQILCEGKMFQNFPMLAVPKSYLPHGIVIYVPYRIFVLLLYALVAIIDCCTVPIREQLLKTVENFQLS